MFSYIDHQQHNFFVRQTLRELKAISVYLSVLVLPHLIFHSPLSLKLISKLSWTYFDPSLINNLIGSPGLANN
jgi:hypothetical protein